MNINIFWFRNDLRITDNPGLFEAAKDSPVMPIYILDDSKIMGSASKWWLHNSLNSLNKSLDNKLNLYMGRPQEIITNLIKENNIKAVYFNINYEPDSIQEESEVKTALEEMNIECKSFNASLLFEPSTILKSDKSSYKVFTPFYQKGYLQAQAPRSPLPKPEKLILFKDSNNKNTISDLNLLPPVRWYEKMEPYWKIGEEEAQKKLLEFLTNNLNTYKESRNFPSKPNVSKLSPHLHFGEISPNQIWYESQIHDLTGNVDLDCFLKELGWREFSYYLLYHFPQLPRKNFQEKFDSFTWTHDDSLLKAWQQGQTGYPIIDAGMRELYETGYMHNRVRMIVASFLVKNLLIDWRFGQDWFNDCLVDADIASNSFNWQWVAGSGADASPYFRIFNPVLQGEKFDSEGLYTLHFVTELNKLPLKYLHKPWECPLHILKNAGVILGETYPKPIIDLKSSRERAMRIYHSLR